MKMPASRRRPATLLAALALWLILVLPVLAGQVSVAGRVLGPDGQGLAGAMVSDGVTLAKTDAKGAFQLASEEGRVVALTAPAGFTPEGPWWWPAERAGNIEARLAPAQTAEPVQVVLLSDPHLMNADFPTEHYPPPPGGNELPMNVWQRVAGQAAQIKPALTVVAGDLCMDGDQGDLAHAEGQMRLAARALAELPRPARALPGNHDLRYHDGNSGGTVDATLWYRHLGPTRHLYLVKGAAWLFLDNPGRGLAPSGKPRSLGQTPPEALAWLKDVLAALPPELPLVLVSHYPLSSPIMGANPLYDGALVKAPGPTGQALRDGDQAAPQIMGLLKGRKVLALINGHEHAHHVSQIGLRGGTLQVIGLPAVCGRWWLGDRTWGPVALPPGYLVTTLVTGPEGPRLDSRFVEVQF